MAPSRKGLECKRYSAEIIAEAIRLVGSGANKQCEVIKQLNIPDGTLRGWLVKAGIKPKTRCRRSSVDSTDSGTSSMAPSPSPPSHREEDLAAAFTLLDFHEIAWKEHDQGVRLVHRICHECPVCF